MLIVFDLDGTLIDSAEDLALSMNATRVHMGLAPLDPKLIYSFVGNGASILVRRALGPEASDAAHADALAFFLRYYRAHALEHTRLYHGVREALAELSAAGHNLAVLTNKPEKISRDIIAALGMGPLFPVVYGGDSFATKKPHPEGLLAILAETSTLAADAWMVGDSAVDVQTGRSAGVQSCGVAWGFQPAACAAENPTAFIDQPAQLAKLFSDAAIS